MWKELIVTRMFEEEKIYMKKVEVGDLYVTILHSTFRVNTRDEIEVMIVS